MSHEDQVYELKTAEFAADGDECVRRDDAARIARAADAEIAKLRAENARLDRLTEEIARLQAGIAALREQWQARRDAWKSEFDEEMNKRGYTAYAAILGGEWYAIESALEGLDALFPPESPA